MNIWGDSEGSGALWRASDFVLDCMKGECGRQQYKRKALFVQDQSPLNCEDWATRCASMIDEPGPEYYDPGISAAVDGCGYDVGINEVGDVIEIVSLRTCKKYECIAVGGGSEPNIIDAVGMPGPVLSVVEVNYTWHGDTFDIQGFMDDCSEQTLTVTVPSQQYVCLYAREVAPGEFYALGTYKLISIRDPGAENTHGLDGARCCVPSPVNFCAENVCRPTITAPLPNSPATWTPPLTILVTRIN